MYKSQYPSKKVVIGYGISMGLQKIAEFSLRRLEPLTFLCLQDDVVLPIFSELNNEHGHYLFHAHYKHAAYCLDCYC